MTSDGGRRRGGGRRATAGRSQGILGPQISSQHQEPGSVGVAPSEPQYVEKEQVPVPGDVLPSVLAQGGCSLLFGDPGRVPGIHWGLLSSPAPSTQSLSSIQLCPAGLARAGEKRGAPGSVACLQTLTAALTTGIPKSIFAMHLR